ncbi:MAG: carotenoid 1,2-hydratase [Burkholderiales bacterium]|nr:carotenoid 1,2-hydratase [Burkholderiales bacterium]
MHAPDFCTSRRQLLSTTLTLPFWPLSSRAAAHSELQFPRDLGSHPDYAIEWWYLTGRLLAREREFGFQLTFFRSRVPATQNMTSAFAAKQLVFAHAAVTDVAGRKLWHDQRIAREGFGIAQASQSDTDIRLRDWSLRRAGTRYQAKAVAGDFSFDLGLNETQTILLQGDRGLSRKGPQPEQSSYYYSLPQLQVSGTLGLGKNSLPVQGTAWLDHEWSQSLLDPLAVGWDWIGMNLLDGGALTAFQLRDKSGKAIWDGGSFRSRAMGVKAQIFARGEVQFAAVRQWTSPLTKANYPVEWAVQTPLGRYRIKAVVDDQELDSRASTGAVYWEGLSELFDSTDRLLGRGYLEMTGYAGALRF